MANNVIRVGLSGVNAQTDTNETHFSLYSDVDNVLIKEKARGSGTVSDTFNATINHNLNYIPFFMVYCEIGASSRYRIANSFDPVGSGWRTISTTTDLVIQNRYSNTYTHYRYYIFYDDMS